MKQEIKNFITETLLNNLKSIKDNDIEVIETDDTYTASITCDIQYRKEDIENAMKLWVIKQKKIY